MATVNWPNVAKGYDDQAQDFRDYGFDFRDLLVRDAANPFFVNTDGTGFTVIDQGPYGGAPVKDQYTGTFTLDSVSIADGTINKLTREHGEFLGSITGLQIPFKDLAAAADTDSKSDDMALWAKAFAGNDILRGSPVIDRLEGFSGNDKLTGRLGADRLFGGEGGDSFIFTSIKDSTVKSAGRDIVYDFSHSQKDKIDLKAIDASTKATGNQAFKYIGSQDFHKKAGELRWEKVIGGVTVYGDVNGDGKADFAITLRQITKLAKDNFLL
jgi:Ca2+-binding RTX toxin-like protein